MVADHCNQADRYDLLGLPHRAFPDARKADGLTAWHAGIHLQCDPCPMAVEPMLDNLSSTASPNSATRLRRALSRSDRTEKAVLPSPTGLAGYGDAGSFARQLVLDVAGFRQGSLPWRDIESRAVFNDRYGVGAHDLLRRLAAAANLTLVQLDWPHLTLDRRDHTFPGTSRSTVDGATTGASALLALHIPDTLNTTRSLSASGAYWLAQLSEMRETVGCPIIIVCHGTADPCPANDGPATGVLRIGFPNAADLSETLSDALNGVLPPSILLRSIRHLESVATAADMTTLARRIRRRARLGDRPVRPEDVDVVAFEDVRPATARLIRAVHAAGATTSLLIHGRIPAFVSIADGPLKREFGCDPHMDVDQALICMLAGCAAEEVLLGRTSVDFLERKRLALLAARRLALLLGIRDDGSRASLSDEDTESDLAATQLRYAYGDAMAHVREHSTVIGNLAADLIDRITLRSQELADFARSNALISDGSGAAS